jgi:hypothetical protein
VRANRRALRTIRDEPDLAVRYVNALIPSLSEAEARRHYERYVAPYFTADGRHDPSVVAQAVPAVAEGNGRVHGARRGRHLPHGTSGGARGVARSLLQRTRPKMAPNC